MVKLVLSWKILHDSLCDGLRIRIGQSGSMALSFGHRAEVLPIVLNRSFHRGICVFQMLVFPAPAVIGGLPESLAVIHTQPIPKRGRVGLFCGRGLS